MPERIRLRRTKGWRRPPRAVVVARPSPWGNPFHVGARYGGRVLSRADAVELYREALTAGRLPFDEDDVRHELRGHDLACWCPEDEPCHADVLLEVANG